MSFISKYNPSILPIMAFQDAVESVNQQLGVLENTQVQAKIAHGFHTVTQSHTLSAPLVALMLSVPAFTALAESFPQADIFNQIPEHKSSPRNKMGMEALEGAVTECENHLKTQLATMVTKLSEVFDMIDSVGEGIETRACDLGTALELAEIDNKAFESAALMTIDSEAYGHLFNVLEEALVNLDQLDAIVALEGSAESLPAVVAGLVEKIAAVGPVVGLRLDAYGVSTGTKDTRFIPTEARLIDKGIDKATLGMFLNRVEGLTNCMSALSLRRDEIIPVLEQEVQNMPDAYTSEGDVIGSEDHAICLTSFVRILSKMLGETVSLGARLSSITEQVLEHEIEDEGCVQ